MTLATVKGRLQTKILTFTIAGPLAVAFAYFDNCYAYITMFLLLIVLGLLLETAWGYAIDYEPGWLTFVMAAIEFLYIFVTIKALDLDYVISGDEATLLEGIVFYFTTWTITKLLLIYIMPIWRISWADNGAEIW